VIYHLGCSLSGARGRSALRGICLRDQRRQAALPGVALEVHRRRYRTSPWVVLSLRQRRSVSRESTSMRWPGLQHRTSTCSMRAAVIARVFARDRGNREVFAQADARASERRAPLTVPQNAVIDVGLDAFRASHTGMCSATPASHQWPILVPSRLGLHRFQCSQTPRQCSQLRDGTRGRKRCALVSPLSRGTWGLGGVRSNYRISKLDMTRLTHERREYRGLIDIRDGR